jgi:hypothetical protein
MAFESFRDFVNVLEAAGELERIGQPVATELEITEIADREMKKPGGGKALLFEQPTVNGQVSPFPPGDQYNGIGSANGDEPAGEIDRGRGGGAGRADESEATDGISRGDEVAGDGVGFAARETEFGEEWRVQGSCT